MKRIGRLALAALLAAASGAAAAEPAAVPFAAAVEQAGRWGVVDAAGRAVVPLMYDAADTTLVEKEKRGADLAMPGRDRLIEVEQNGKYGMYDRTGQTIIPVSYESRTPWADGVTAVQIRKGELGFYRDDGLRIAPPVYEAVSDMRGGWAVVKKDGRYGYVSRDGARIDPVYDEAHYFSEGYAPVKQKKWGVIDESGALVVPCQYDDAGPSVSDGLLAVRKDNHWGFIDMTGAEKVPFIYKDVHPLFAEHLTAVENDDKLWGFIDSAGRVTAEPVFSAVVTPFSEGLAGVVTKDGKAYARPDGSIAFHADYDRIYAFDNGLAEYLEGEAVYARSRSPISIGIGIGIGWGHRHCHHPWGWGVGWPVWGPWWYDDWYSGPSRVVNVKRGYMGHTGRLVAPADLSRVYPAMEKGILVFNRNRFGLLDRTGQYVIHTEYRALTPVPSEDYLLARNEDKDWGILSFTGETLVPFAWDALTPLGGGFLAGKKDGKWALLRKDGALLTEPVYKEIRAYGDGLFPANLRGTWLYLDETGKEALSFPGKAQDALPFSHGFGAVKVDGKWGVIDRSGAFTAPPVYSALKIL